MPARSELWLPIVWAGILCLFFLQVNTGIADNGDFERSAGWLLDKPAGFASNTPPIGSAERADRYFNLWHPEWEYRGTFDFAPYMLSSYQLILFLGWLVNETAGMEQYSLIAAGLVSRVLLLAIIVLLGRELFDRTWLLWAAVPAFIFADSRYVAFLNSFYQEHAAILFFLLLLLALVRVVRYGGAWNLAFFALALLLFSTAKVQLLFTPLVLLVAFLAARHLVKIASWKMASLLLAVQLLVTPLLLNNKFSVHNHYNALYNGALFFDRGYFPEWLRPELQECVGVQVWSQDPNCFARQDSVIVLRQIGEVYARNPVSLFKGIDYGIRHLNLTDMALYSLETKAVPSFHAAGVANLWNRAKRLAAGFPVYIEMACILALLILGRRRVPHLAFVSLFLFGFVLSQVAVSIIGEGSVDIEKHLLLANVALDVAAVVSLFILYRLLRRDAAAPSLTPAEAATP